MCGIGEATQRLTPYRRHAGNCGRERNQADVDRLETRHANLERLGV